MDLANQKINLNKTLNFHMNRRGGLKAKGKKQHEEWNCTEYRIVNRDQYFH